MLISYTQKNPSKQQRTAAEWDANPFTFTDNVYSSNISQILGALVGHKRYVITRIA